MVWLFDCTRVGLSTTQIKFFCVFALNSEFFATNFTYGRTTKRMARVKPVWLGIGVALTFIAASSYMHLRPASYSFVAQFSGQKVIADESSGSIRSRTFHFAATQSEVEPAMAKELLAKGWRLRYPPKTFWLTRGRDESAIIFETPSEDGRTFRSHVVIDEQLPWLIQQWNDLTKR
jgi:hypothetical protein